MVFVTHLQKRVKIKCIIVMASPKICVDKDWQRIAKR